MLLVSCEINSPNCGFYIPPREYPAETLPYKVYMVCGIRRLSKLTWLARLGPSLLLAPQNTDLAYKLYLFPMLSSTCTAFQERRGFSIV